MRRLRVVDGFEILLHGTIVVCFLIEIVSILAIDDVLMHDVQVGLQRQVDGKNVQVALIQDIKLLL